MTVVQILCTIDASPRTYLASTALQPACSGTRWRGSESASRAAGAALFGGAHMIVRMRAPRAVIVDCVLKMNRARVHRSTIASCARCAVLQSGQSACRGVDVAWAPSAGARRTGRKLVRVHSLCPCSAAYAVNATIKAARRSLLSDDSCPCCVGLVVCFSSIRNLAR